MNPERIPYGRDATRFFELRHPNSEVAGLCGFIHGGFGRVKYDLSYLNPLCATLAAVGVTTANLEYRRVGQPGSGWPGRLRMLLPESKLRANSLAACRSSLAICRGHLTLRSAAEIQLMGKPQIGYWSNANYCFQSDGLLRQAVVEFMGGTPVAIPHRYEEASGNSHASLAPSLMVHGRNDADVPFDITRAFMWTRRNDPSRRVCSRFRGQAKWI